MNAEPRGLGSPQPDTTARERCEFSTTKPKGAMSQSVRAGSATRYLRCKNKATRTITVTEASLSWVREREVRCCALHARLNAEQGWLP